MLLKTLFTSFLALLCSVVMAVVNINTATVQELQSLKGIGPKKAADIVAYRDANGGFKSVDDLTKVKGIGTKTLDKFRTEVAIGAAPTVKKEAKPAVSESSATKTKTAVAK